MRLSYSGISTFLNCRRKYFYGYIKKIKSKLINDNYIVGNATHFGLNKIFNKCKDYDLQTKEYFQKQVELSRKTMIISPEQEQKLIEGKISVLGMLKGYTFAHSKFLKTSKCIDNEREFLYEIEDGVSIYGKMDNIFKTGAKQYVHELKTTRYLNMDYVKNMQGAMQPLIYLYYNQEFEKDKKKKLSGIIYDVIRKPSIRLGKKESYPQFLSRLEEYYLDESKEMELYHMEIIEIPRLSKNCIFNTVNHVIDDIKECDENTKFQKGRYYQDFGFCFIKQRCEFWNICHMGVSESDQTQYINKEEH